MRYDPVGHPSLRVVLQTKKAFSATEHAHHTQSYREKAASSSSVAGGGGGGSVGDETTTRTHYPGNIGVLDLLYFWFAPTLCYQPDYPRSKKVSEVWYPIVDLATW